MNNEFKKYRQNWQFALAYLEDIIMFSCKADERVLHGCTLLQLLHKACDRLIFKKCNCFTERLDYLWNVLRPGELEFADRTTDEIIDLKAPCSVAKLKSFLGLWKVFSQLVPNFTCKFENLNKKLKMGESRTSNTLKQKEHDPLATLQENLVSASVLALTCSKGDLTLAANACNTCR